MKECIKKYLFSFADESKNKTLSVILSSLLSYQHLENSSRLSLLSNFLYLRLFVLDCFHLP